MTVQTFRKNYKTSKVIINYTNLSWTLNSEFDAHYLRPKIKQWSSFPRKNLLMLSKQVIIMM